MQYTLSAILIVTCSLTAFAAENSQKEYIEKTSVPAKVAYERAKIWASQAYKNNAKDMIEVDDSANSKFVSRAEVSDCRAFDDHLYHIKFLVSFEAKDKRVKILFDKIHGTSFGYMRGNDRVTTTETLKGVRPQSDNELESIAKECLEPLKDDLIKEINSKKGSENW